MIKYFNYILFTILITLFFLFNINNKISTNINALLPQSENKELLQEFLSFESNKKVLIAVKGLDKKSLEELKEFERNIQKISGIKKENNIQPKSFIQYKDKYYFYLNEINKNKTASLDVKEELNSLYNSIVNSFITININKIDPFELVKQKEVQINIKNGKLVLEDYGYISIYSLNKDINSLNTYEKIYDEIKNIETKNITTFSSIYYFVENSRYIKNDVNKIVLLAGTLLIFLYFFILRNVSLLSNTLLTLASSSLFATLILTFIYEEISLFVLVFGLSISTIAIDYMFHHYFHKNYEKESAFNKEVFLGFFTTFSAFFILSFCNFLLIEQITRFAMVSLLISYVIFAFVYPKISFKQKDFKLFNQNKISIKKFYFFAISILVLFFSLQNINLDFDIKSLDYNNKSLKEKEEFFKNKFDKNRQKTVLIKASNINELILFNEKIKGLDPLATSSLDKLLSKEKFERTYKNLEKSSLKEIKRSLDKELLNTSFKKDSFINAYDYEVNKPSYSYEQLREFGIIIKQYKNEYISYINVSNNKYERILDEDFIYSLSLKTLFEKNLQKELEKIIILGLSSLIFITLIIIFITKSKMIQALNFLLFPSALIFLYLSFIPVNILHIFMFFIILSISIDYAIYSSKDNSKQTNKAIIFSAISSFAGFGVLIFSDINSLFSIGSVATLGIFAILILIFFQKVANASKSL